MDEQYLQMLMELLAAQQGGGMPMGDPGLAYGPGGRVPQYRTQYTGFMSDGTVRDLLQRAMVNQDQFSADAFISLRPELKPLVARAVAEAGHDPYNAYALFDDDPYRTALLDIALRQEGAQPPQIDFEGGGYADVNDDGRVDVQDLTYDQYMDAVLKQYADQQKAVRTGQVDMFGGGVSINRPYMDVLQERLADYQSALDDFVTQASPTAQRNMNQIEALWEGLGGMPFPGMGSGAPTYDGVSPAFQGEGNIFAGSPSGREPAALRELREVQAAGGNAADCEEFTRRYLARHGVDFAANRAERDRGSREITEGVRRAANRNPKRPTTVKDVQRQANSRHFARASQQMR